MKRKNLNNSRDLKGIILEMELKIKNSESLIKQDIAQLKGNLRPQHLIRTTLTTLGEAPEVKKLFLNAAISVALGYFSRLSGRFAMQSVIRISENIINDQILLFEQNKPNNFLTKTIQFLRKFTPHDALLYAYIKSN